MDLTTTIEKHREALKRILAALLAMAGIAPRRFGDTSMTLPRHLHRAVLRLLRPAESAARRLIVALARGVPAPRRARSASPPKTGTGIVLPFGKPRPGAPDAARAARQPSFPLLDPLRRSGFRRRPVATSVPRICIPGITGFFAVPPRTPPSRDDPVGSMRLAWRLDMLARVLDDLPGQAKRFARWKARRDRARDAGRIHRIAPLRRGRPPGGRLSRYDPDALHRGNVREIDEILAHAHALALYAERPDSS